MAMLGLLVILIGCSQSTAEVGSPLSEVDQRITHWITGESDWPDIKINYYAIRHNRLCYEAVHDGEGWYGNSSRVEGRWYVTIPSVMLHSMECGARNVGSI